MFQRTIIKNNATLVFTDDFSIAGETNIYYSTTQLGVELVLGLLALGVGLFIMLTRQQYIFGIITCAVGGFFVFRSSRKWMDKTPQVIISNEGITTKTAGLIRWAAIRDEGVIREGLGKNTHFYLYFEHPTGHVKVLIDELATNRNKLSELLVLYRGRSSQQRR